MGRQKVARHKDGRLLELFWSAPEIREPRVTLHFAEVDGRAICARVEIGADFDHPGEAMPVPITTAVLRQIPLSTLIEKAVMEMVGTFETVAELEWPTSPTAKKRLPVAQRAAHKPLRPGRPTLYDRSHYKRVAGIYNAAVRAGSRAPTKAVAESERVSKSAAAKWVARAREMGLIPATR